MDDINTTIEPTAEATEENNPTESTLDASEILTLLESAQRSIDTIRTMLAGGGRITSLAGRARATTIPTAVDIEGAKIIEGAFDGQNMVGPDGKQYSVPANYASKSKLVEGDVLKLTITRDGSFIYKQIGPVDRQRIIGQLVRDEVTGEYKVVAEGKSYKVLLASITYFKGETGDDVVILVPKAGEPRWAAVENIIKQGTTTELVI
jgi:hypothetical protein